jgi:hypothetical protein
MEIKTYFIAKPMDYEFGWWDEGTGELTEEGGKKQGFSPGSTALPSTSV